MISLVYQVMLFRSGGHTINMATKAYHHLQCGTMSLSAEAFYQVLYIVKEKRITFSKFVSEDCFVVFEP